MIFFIAWEGRWQFAIPPLHETSWVQKFHTGDKSLPDLGSTFEWLWREGNLPPAIKSTTQIWEVTLHEYGISTVAPQMSFTGKPVMVSLMSAVSMAIIFIAFWLGAYKRADCLLCVSSPFHYCWVPSQDSQDHNLNFCRWLRTCDVSN